MTVPKPELHSPTRQRPMGALASHSAEKTGRRKTKSAKSTSSSVNTIEGAVLRALGMTASMTAKESTTSTSKEARAIARLQQAIEQYGTRGADIVRFRPKGAADRRIRIEYLPDPVSPGSVLMRLTPATAGRLPEATSSRADLLLTQEAADMLNVSRPYLTKLVDSGRFAGVIRTAAGHRRIPRAEVERVRDEMKLDRRKALDDIEESTSALRQKELDTARAKSKRRWVSKSAR